MPNYTANYQLHQWLPEDNFLRTDFNEDLAKIDAAIKGVSTSAASQASAAAQTASAADAKAQRALDNLEPLSYNLYSLMLQNYYDGKQTGPKRALIFDGFLDTGEVASMSTGIARIGSLNALRLHAVGDGNRVHNYGTSNTVTVGNRSDTWTAGGRCRATGIKLRLYGGGNGSTANITVTLSSGSQTTSATTSYQYTSLTEVTLTFSSSIVLEGGASCTLSINGWGSQTAIYTSASGELGYTLLCTPLNYPTGTITAAARATGVTAGRALAWVRYSGGAVALALNGTAMTAVGSRSTQTLTGQSCTEQSFRLDAAVTSPLTVKLTLTAGSSATVTVYDYGVMLL